MRAFLSRAATRFKRFHSDEQGDEGVNKVLIIAMIVIPLVIVLIAFGDAIVGFFEEQWENLTGKEVDEGEFN